MNTAVLNLSDEELKEKFNNLKNRQDIANLLDITDYQLRYHLYISPIKYAYTEFLIPKKSGGNRLIIKPTTSLKIIQKKLNQVLTAVYRPKPSTHGFTRGKSIVTNAEKHLRQRYLLNIDIQDFFFSINFGRVRGLFLAKPYGCTKEVATVLAQICCYENQLPQGASTSPIISNMICSRLDSELQKLAKKHQCIYTRYADDITFSTSRFKFPPRLALFSIESDAIVLGKELIKIIKDNGFKINESKTRLQSKYGHQEVTGITVNEKLNINRKYIRRIRAILHAWKKYGIEKTETEFWNKYDKKHRYYKDRASFESIIKSRIEFIGYVRGKDDLIYLKFLRQLADLSPHLVDISKINSIIQKRDNSIQDNKLFKAEIWTEGKTDIKHLKAAFQNLIEHKQYNFELSYKEDLNDQKQGSSELLKMCEQYCKSPRNTPIIAIFDRDEANYVVKAHRDDVGFKNWGNNVYSFAIPIPPHRKDLKEICIEHYYTNEEICREDHNKRRIFLSNEFNHHSGRHKSLNFVVSNSKKINVNKLTIIDGEVYNENNQNVALSKNDFADSIYHKKKNFNNFDFNAFNNIFEIIDKIIKNSSN
ncbi:MAG: reverse transcriptase domain-containing protein [Pleurocapsa sp. MO_192.B19]|nr:reverse transcriptase domain-containing protein [Pleurocapsa sp. MO_192.B19]